MTIRAITGYGKPFVVSFIFLELSLHAAVSVAAMESTLPAELMFEGVSLLKAGGGDGEYEGRRHTAEFPIVMREAEADAVEFPLTVEDNMENIMRASIQNHNNNAQNDDGGDDEMKSQHKHGAHFNMADKLMQQQQQQRKQQQHDTELNNGETKMFPIWLQQMHKDPSQQQHVREYNNNNNKAFTNAQQQHKHFSHTHPLTTHESPPSATAPAPVPTASRHCSIEISTKIPGKCQPMTPIGSACISGEYMEVYGSLDCM